MRPLLLSLALLLLACGDDSSSDPDAAGNPDPDGNVAIDAAEPEPDAGPDAAPGTLCQRLCIVIQLCFGEGGPGCVAECEPALAKCSPEELDTLDGCAGESCDGFEECLFGVECVGGGGGPVCGDGTCDGDESCSFCPDDCGACVCGDSTCSPGECATCATDCPGGCVCPHQTCTVGELLDPGCDPCVGQVCAVDPFCCENSWDVTCVGEAESICGKDCPDVCGDGLCSPGEEETCPEDCVIDPDPGVDGGVPEIDAAP